MMGDFRIPLIELISQLFPFHRALYTLSVTLLRLGYESREKQIKKTSVWG